MIKHNRRVAWLVALFCAALAAVVCLQAFVVEPTYAWADQSTTSSDAYRDRANADEQAQEQAKQAQQDQSAQADVDGAAANKPDGVYYGSAEGYQSIITVAVTVADGRITDIKIVSHADDQTYVDRAMKETQIIINAQSTDVDTVSGVTFSSTGIREAVKDALSGDGASAATNTVWFSVAMIVIAVLLFAAAAVFARRWLQAKRQADRRRDARIQRVLIQLMFFILAPSSFASGYMGLKSLFMQIQVMNTQRGYQFEVMSFTILLAVLLVLTVLLGRFFCGYVCAFGFVGDVLYKLSSAVQKKLGVSLPAVPLKVERILSFGKYVVLVVECALILAGFTMAINANSPWTAYSSVTGLMFSRITIVGGILLALIVVGMPWKERFFCEYLCPLGAVFSLMPTLPTGRMRRERPKCIKGCARCRDNCPVSIEPTGRVLAGECIMCGRCAEVCPAHNVTCGLEVRADELARRAGADKKFDGTTDEEGHIPVEQEHERLRRVHELLLSRPVSVLWKVALFLLVLWLMHATRYIPFI